ncbi:aldo/keto reductase family oxidoreductase [soil metagenome]
MATARDKTLQDVNRMGYGAMQLSGPRIFGPPADRAEAVRVLRRAVEWGVDHIDTSDFYGPHVTNEVIREALAPYDDDLVLVSKVGARRDDAGAWLPAFSPDEIRQAVHDNLTRLGVERLGAVNLRVMDGHQGSIVPQWEVLAELQQQGLVGELGLSTVTESHLAEVEGIAPVACVQNAYNIALRDDDALIDHLAERDIAYVPYFPLGGFSPLDLTELDVIAEQHGATGRQVALAWLLQRSPNILLIPGTSSVAHLEENLASADLMLTDADVARLDALHAP